MPRPENDVLIVDDDLGSLRALSSLLRLGGLLPRPVRMAEPPKLVLLDVRMPDVSGLEVCRHFQREERLRQTPVIFPQRPGGGHRQGRGLPRRGTPGTWPSSGRSAPPSGSTPGRPWPGGASRRPASRSL